MSHSHWRLPILALAAVCFLMQGSVPTRADDTAPTPSPAASGTPADAPPDGYPPIPGITSQFGDFRGQFVSLTDPKAIPADQLMELGDDEEVLGLSINGEE